MYKKNVYLYKNIREYQWMYCQNFKAILKNVQTNVRFLFIEIGTYYQTFKHIKTKFYTFHNGRSRMLCVKVSSITVDVTMNYKFSNACLLIWM